MARVKDKIHICENCKIPRPQITWNGKTIILKGHGHYLVQFMEKVYIAPELLLHYILAHNYCPPDEFIKAIISGKFMTKDDLVITWREE